MNADAFFNLGVSKHGSTLRKLPKDGFLAFASVKKLEASPTWKLHVKDEGQTDEVHEHLKIRRFDHFMSMAITIEKFNSVTKVYEKNTKRKYKMFNTRNAVEKFVESLPPYRRHLEEMIFTDTPHRFYMDIERDMPGCTQEQLDGMLDFLLVRFLPIVTEFFNDTFGINCNEDDWRICVASQVDKKFSAHVILCCPYYCATRLCSWTIAGLLARYLGRIRDESFVKWYNVNPENAIVSEKIVDFHVYHEGLRNMRFLGCIKLHGKLGIDWKEMRPFRAIESQKHLPWTDFLATLNHAPKDENLRRFVVTPDSLAVLEEWINIETGEMTFVSKDFKNLMNRLGGSARSNSFSAPALRRVKSTSSGGVSHTTDEVLASVLKMIKAMGNIDTVTGHNFESRQQRCQEEKQLQTKFFSVAKKLGTKMLELLHPGNYGSEQPVDESRGEVFKIRFSTLVKQNGRTVMRVNENGVRKEQRLCYFSFEEKTAYLPCQNGTHTAELAVMSDLSVEYFCYGCKTEREVIIYSPIERFTVRPKLYDCRPTEFSGDIDYMNYSADNDYDTESSPFMRDIKKLPVSGLYWDQNERRTVMLHGGMGCGKSTACKAYLDRTADIIREQTGREPRVLSITFRMMLARSNSRTFDLVAYNDEDVPQELFDFDRVACQLDSICRLGRVEGEAHFVLKDPYDIILLDESESILSHLSSSTLERRRAEVFEVFKRLVARANTVIVADADMARRTHHFIAAVRPVNASCCLEYHRNPFVPKDIQYIDYKYLNSWLNELTEAVLGPELKRVFIVSNNKGKLKTLQRYLQQELKKRVASLGKKRLTGQRQKHFRALQSLQTDPDFIRVIDAENNGADKKRMAEECNEMWSAYRVLGITPVVGAGISFDEPDHFYEAYVFATPSSCCPRAINQLLGRVRHLKENRVRLFIDEGIGRVSTVIDEDGLYRKIKRQALDIKCVRLDRMSLRFDPEEGTMAYCLRRDDDLLVRLHAMNEEESLKGRADFRCELIRVLQRNNPALNYRFNTRGAFKTDTNAMLRFDNISNMIEDEEVYALSTQQEEHDGLELRRLKRNNDKGVMAFPEDEEKQENVVRIIDKSEVAQQLGIEQDTSEDVFEAYITLLNFLPDGLETVANAARYLFASLYHLKISQDNLMEETNYNLEGGEGVFKIKEKVAQGIDNLFYRRKYWMNKLLFIAGFSEQDGPEAENAPPIDRLEGHSSLQTSNLDTEDCQAWLKQHVPAILDDLGAQMEKGTVKLKDPLPEGERQRKPDDYPRKNVTWLLKAFLKKYTGLSVTGTSRPEDGKPKKIKCTAHGACYLQRNDEMEFRVLLAIVHQWLLVKSDSEEPWIKDAREKCLVVCEDLNIGLLPGMKREQGVLDHEDLDEDTFIVYCRSTIEQNRSRKTLQLKSKRTRKRGKADDKENQPETTAEEPEQKFEKKWKKILDVHVGPNMYQQKNPVIYLENLLSEGYKFRTKKEMLRCKAEMKKKLEKLE